MLLPPFTHHRPTELAEAHELIARFGDEASVYAGGTELLLAMKARVLRYAHLIDLKRIAALDGIRREKDEIVIGARVSHHRLAIDPLVNELVPAYAALSNNVANIRVRVAGTLAGNLCFAEPHADPPALLAVLGASVELGNGETTRRVAVADFITAEFTTVREPDELLVAVRIPVPPPQSTFSYQSFGHLERPAVGIASGCARQDGTWRYRVWAGAISDRPTCLDDLEAALAGVPPSDLPDVLPAAAVTAGASLAAYDDIHGSADYKQHLVGVLAQRAVRAAADACLAKEASHG
jgi:carbon-monoxide dehydrogenase medium subunit